MSEKVWHYLSVNRGRYLCDAHGSFCDSGDNYAVECPLCSADGAKKWTVNNVDRALQILKNLQNRSLRSVTVVTGTIGFLSVVTVLSSKLAGSEASTILGRGNFFALFALSAWLISVGLYLFSMSHMAVTSKGKFLAFTTLQWEKMIADFIRQTERLHSWAGVAFFAGIFNLVAAIAIAIF